MGRDGRMSECAGGRNAGAPVPAADRLPDMPDTVRISSRSRGLLSMIKSRTGMQQPAAARLGLCLSIADPVPPNPAEYNADGTEMSVYDVFGGGRYFDAYCALFAYACESGGAAADDRPELLRAHVNRGITMLFARAHTISDVGLMTAAAGRKPVRKAGGGGGGGNEN